MQPHAANRSSLFKPDCMLLYGISGSQYQSRCLRHERSTQRCRSGLRGHSQNGNCQYSAGTSALVVSRWRSGSSRYTGSSLVFGGFDYATISMNGIVRPGSIMGVTGWQPSLWRDTCVISRWGWSYCPYLDTAHWHHFLRSRCRPHSQITYWRLTHYSSWWSYMGSCTSPGYQPSTASQPSFEWSFPFSTQPTFTPRPGLATPHLLASGVPLWYSPGRSLPWLCVPSPSLHCRKCAKHTSTSSISLTCWL